MFALILGSSKGSAGDGVCLKIYHRWRKLRYGEIAAACVLAAIPIFLLSVYAQRYMVRGLSLGAVKQ